MHFSLHVLSFLHIFHSLSRMHYRALLLTSMRSVYGCVQCERGVTLCWDALTPPSPCPQDQLLPGLWSVRELHRVLGGSASDRLPAAQRGPALRALRPRLRGRRRLPLRHHLVRVAVPVHSSRALGHEPRARNHQSTESLTSKRLKTHLFRVHPDSAQSPPPLPPYTRLTHLLYVLRPGTSCTHLT